MYKEDTAALKMLSMRFPDKSKKYLMRTLRKHKGDYEDTVAALQGSIVSRLFTFTICVLRSVFDQLLTRLTSGDSEKLVSKLKHIVMSKCPLFPNNLQTYLPYQEYYRGDFYRKEAEKCADKKKNYNEQANKYSRMKNKVSAKHYSMLAKRESWNMDEANHLAALTFLSENLENKNANDTIDLHNLYKGEAVQSLDIFLDKEICMIQRQKDACKMLSVVTGKGLHSKNQVSVLKPLIKNRLIERGLRFNEVKGNSGILRVTVRYDSKLTTDVKMKPIDSTKPKTVKSTFIFTRMLNWFLK